MSAPVLHVLAGPNGSGKSTFVQTVLQSVTHLPFINADEIAARRWPGREEEHGYEASIAPMRARDGALARKRSFITETVFSYPSKVELIQRSILAGYLVTMDVILVPEDVTVLRVKYRVAQGGHSVPEVKIRERYRRLWDLVAEARDHAHRCVVYDNSLASKLFSLVATYENGRLVGEPKWPNWTPAALTR